jgi:hypothetical protein
VLVACIVLMTQASAAAQDASDVAGAFRPLAKEASATDPQADSLDGPFPYEEQEPVVATRQS